MPIYDRPMEVYFMGLIDYLAKGLRIKKTKFNYYNNSKYEKSKCPICNQVCYNKKDLALHLKYNHPDVASTPGP